MKNEQFQESYVEKVLDNGLKVVLWNKKDYVKSLFMLSTPFGSFDLNQSDGNNDYHFPAGCAHFLEHKMFEMAHGDVMEAFSKLSANVNAYTSFQETCYYFTTTADYREPLELLLDFVGQLTISDNSVAKEKPIIISEYQMYQKESNARLLMEMLRSLFKNHPIKNDVVGNEESIQAISIDDLNQAYQLNYHPKKMILIGVGDFNPDEVFELVAKNQKAKQVLDIPLTKRVYLEESLEVARPYYEMKMDISIPKVAIGFKLAGINDHKMRIKWEWCIRYIIDAHFTMLNPDYQKWLDEEYFLDYLGIEADFGSNHGCIFFYGDTNRIEAFFGLITKEMEKVKKQGISETTIKQLKRRYLASNIRDYQNFDDIAMLCYQAYYNGYDYFYVNSIFESIEAKDINDVLKQINLDNIAKVVIKSNKG